MKYIPLLALLGCASLKPLPQQSLDCVRAEATLANGVKAAQCIASGGGTQAVENCYLAICEGVCLDILQCEAQALYQDLGHAQSVSATVGIPTTTIQARAQAYLQSKGSLVAPSNP
jgi:hypothetical protein